MKKRILIAFLAMTVTLAGCQQASNIETQTVDLPQSKLETTLDTVDAPASDEPLGDGQNGIADEINQEAQGTQEEPAETYTGIVMIEGMEEEVTYTRFESDTFSIYYDADFFELVDWTPADIEIPNLITTAQMNDELIAKHMTEHVTFAPMSLGIDPNETQMNIYCFSNVSPTEWINDRIAEFAMKDQQVEVFYNLNIEALPNMVRCTSYEEDVMERLYLIPMENAVFAIELDMRWYTTGGMEPRLEAMLDTFRGSDLNQNGMEPVVEEIGE